MTIITVCLKLVITLVRVIDLCWGMGKSRDWGVRIQPRSSRYVQPYLTRATPIRQLVMKVPMTAILSFLPAFFKPLPISPRVAVSSGDQWLNCIPLLVASVLFSFYDHKRERNTRFIQVDVYKALYFSY